MRKRKLEGLGKLRGKQELKKIGLWIQTKIRKQDYAKLKKVNKFRIDQI